MPAGCTGFPCCYLCPDNLAMSPPSTGLAAAGSPEAESAGCMGGWGQGQ